MNLMEMISMQHEYTQSMIRDLDNVFHETSITEECNEVKRELEYCAARKILFTKIIDEYRKWEELTTLLLFLETNSEPDTTPNKFIEALKYPLDDEGYYSAWDRCISSGDSAAKIRRATENEKKEIEKRVGELQKLERCYELIRALTALRK
jgi:hypothetical protein